MKSQESDRRSFLAAGAALSLGAVLPGPADGQTPATQMLAQGGASPAPATPPPGRLTFHAIDTFHGATVGTLRVDVSMLEGGEYRSLKTFDTVKNGRSDGAWYEGATFKPGRYELVMRVDDYYAALGTKLPTPPFLSKVPLRFNVANANDRYHIAVLFGPWSYAYYRGS